MADLLFALALAATPIAVGAIAGVIAHRRRQARRAARARQLGLHLVE